LIRNGFPLGHGPHVVARTDQFTAGNQTGQLLEEEAALASTTEA
jgi:hypothetical protein